MDSESKQEFKTMRIKLVDIEMAVQKIIAYNEGLDVKERLSSIESAIEKRCTWDKVLIMEEEIKGKASTKHLYMMASFLTGLGGLFVSFLKFGLK